MPRELYLVTPAPVSIESLVAAAAVVDDQLGVRALYGGAALQLVDDADVAVLTIENPRLLQDPARRQSGDNWSRIRCCRGLVDRGRHAVGI